MEHRNVAWFVAIVIVLALLVANLIASAFIVGLGDWEMSQGPLTVALRTVWGTWVVVVLALLLTRVTVFGWSFRRYFRWPGDEERPAGMPRPTLAPWYKSGAASFAFTVTLVSLTGSAAIATTILWILEDVVGDSVFWLVFKIVWGSWWVLSIALVLARVAIFGWHRSKAVQGSQSEASSTPAEHSSEKQT